jgi:DNA end-binding protein Ku
MLMSTLRSADEVRTAEFAIPDTGGIDPDMLSIAETIITRARTKFDPAGFRDSYQDALRGLVDDKLRGIATAPRAFAEPAKVIDLMEALKRSLVESGALPAPAKAGRPKVADRNQPQLLMPVRGGKAKKPAAEAKPAPSVAPPARRKKAS